MSQLEEGIALARRGEQDAARALLKHVIHNDPENEDAWLWLAWVAESREDSLRLLQEAEALLPDSERIRDAISWARQELGQVHGQHTAVEEPEGGLGARPKRAASWRDGQTEVAAKGSRRGRGSHKPAAAPTPARPVAPHVAQKAGRPQR
jgi:tetratricopeptide (TPR) repeat protein